MRILLTIIASVATSLVAVAQPLRESYLLNDDWKFFTEDEVSHDNAHYVTLPHTWNSGVGGENVEFEQTTVNYLRELYIPAEYASKRLFLRFGGVQSVADVFLNGRHVAEHRGGYTAFTVEITHRVNFGAWNSLLVMVSNSRRNDLMPISSDLAPYGGIYRDVELVVTNKDMISLTHYSSDGVYVEQHRVSSEQASGVVRVFLSSANNDHQMLHVRIVGPDGYEAFSRSVRVSKSDARNSLAIPYEIPNPELWCPESPMLYNVEVALHNDSEVLDRVSVVTGFRSIEIGDDNRLYLNGEMVDVRGVNYAHDRYGRGLAFDRDAYDEDLATISDLGANALRSLSGPHDGYLYEQCDRRGMLAWVDMPFTRSTTIFGDICYIPTPAFRESGFEQLREIVAQNFNHPSIIMWGLFSCVSQRGDSVIDYIKELNTLAHELDASRPTVACSNADGDINFITDLIVLRQNVGWEKGSPDDVSVWCNQLATNKRWRQLRYGVCYGEEGVMTHSTEQIKRYDRGSRHLPERRQTYMHERYADIVSQSGIFWGVWLDNMFDYASPQRAYGLNQSGLVTFDRDGRKDAYYMYRARWNSEEPTLHIAERRWQTRCDTLQSITLYTSSSSPMLRRENDTLPLRRVAAGVYRADSVVVHGSARIIAVDTLSGQRDSIIIRTGNVRGAR